MLGHGYFDGIEGIYSVLGGHKHMADLWGVFPPCSKFILQENGLG